MKRLELIVGIILGMIVAGLIMAGTMQYAKTKVGSVQENQEVQGIQKPIICASYNNKQRFRLVHYRYTRDGMLDIPSGQLFGARRCTKPRPKTRMKHAAWHREDLPGGENE